VFETESRRRAGAPSAAFPLFRRCATKTDMSGNSQVLVGDVGGTHARFAIVDTGAEPFSVSHRLELTDDSFSSFGEALKTYLNRSGAAQPDAAALAVAGPVTNGSVKFTNRGWEMSEDQLRGAGFAHALLINDFAALAFVLPQLKPEQLHTIGPELPGLDGAPVTVLGAGTGFGVACLARYRGRSVPVATEGGHMSFAPHGDAEMAVLGMLAKRFGHVSIERVLSGPGLENVYGALEEIAGRKAEDLSAEEITKRGEAGEGPCRDALDLFCSVYGAVAGDFALAHGARGGVYLAGGIAAKIESYLEASDFRARFEDKGRLSYYVQPIPTKLIVEENAAFLGAAHASLEFRDA
jgi:glucokinase